MEKNKTTEQTTSERTQEQTMPKIKVIYLKAGVDEKPEVLEIERDNLEQKKELLNCRTIKIVARKIFGKHYFIICDDEGRLKDDYVVSGLGYNFDLAFVGNLLICGIDTVEDGELELGSLSDEDIKQIKRSIIEYARINKKTGEKSRAYAVCVSYGR